MSLADTLKCINLFLCVYKQNRKCSIFLHWGGKHFPSSVKDTASLQKLKTDLKITFTSFPDVLYFTKKAKQ